MTARFRFSSCAVSGTCFSESTVSPCLARFYCQYHKQATIARSIAVHRFSFIYIMIYNISAGAEVRTPTASGFSKPIRKTSRRKARILRSEASGTTRSICPEIPSALARPVSPQVFPTDRLSRVIQSAFSPDFTAKCRRFVGIAASGQCRNDPMIIPAPFPGQNQLYA